MCLTVWIFLKQIHIWWTNQNYKTITRRGTTMSYNLSLNKQQIVLTYYLWDIYTNYEIYFYMWFMYFAEDEIQCKLICCFLLPVTRVLTVWCSQQVTNLKQYCSIFTRLCVVDIPFRHVFSVTLKSCRGSTAWVYPTKL